MEICGIDEAGRGPLAGPLVVAGVIFKNRDNWIEELNDSKKLSEKKREKLFNIIKENSLYHIVFIDNKTIDENGISYSINFALNEIKQNLKAKKYIFDGNSNFNVKDIETLVKGDSKVKEISAASILAKVSRDRFMIDISKKYPEYEFHKHKGYITKQHIEKVKEFGFCEIHRKSFKVKSLKEFY